MSDPAILLRQADLGHDGHIVMRRVDLRVDHGERVIVLGGNGAGKSTLLAACAGMPPAIAGTVRVLGHDALRERAAVHSRTGWLGHREGLYAALSVEENITLFARLRGHRKADAANAARSTLDAVGMATHGQLAYGACSRGMQRRAGLARAFIGRPELLLLDEPEAGLDRAARHAFVATLRSLGTRTIFLSTHEPEAYRGWAHRIIALDDGAIVHDTAPDDPAAVPGPLDDARFDAALEATR